MQLSQKQTQTTEQSTARQFWDEQMERHPKFHGTLSIIGEAADFFLNGHAVVKAGHWVIVTSGRIAETALLFATLWITAINVAPNFITQIAGGTTNVNTLNALSLMAFSLLPEIIVFSAIIITYEHWQRFFRDRKANNPAWIWGCLYTLPTSTFLIMTVVTLGSFVSRDGAIAQITGLAIVIRCLAGWFYALIELVYITLGKRTGYTITTHQVEDRMAEIVATTQATLEQTAASVINQAVVNQIIPALTPVISAQIDASKNAIVTEVAASTSIDYQQIAETIIPLLEATIKEAESSAPILDVEAITEAVSKNLEARFEALMRQQIATLEAKNEARGAAKPRQSEAHQKTRRAKIPASQSITEASTKVLALRQRGTAPTEKRAAVYALLDANERLSSYEIAEQTGIPPSTIQRYMRDWKTQRSEAADEAEHEATDTAM